MSQEIYQVIFKIYKYLAPLEGSPRFGD